MGDRVLDRVTGETVTIVREYEVMRSIPDQNMLVKDKDGKVYSIRRTMLDELPKQDRRNWRVHIEGYLSVNARDPDEAREMTNAKLGKISDQLQMPVRVDRIEEIT